MTSSTPQTTINKPLIFLFGPTGVGKTALLEELFLNGFQVISTDSKQIYRQLDIGSAKPSKTTLEKIKHHLIDIRDPSESFSVGEFVKLADECCQQIYSHNSIPILCGGTAYYFKHFYFGLPTSPKSDESIREEVKTLLKEQGPDYCYSYLKKIDPLSAEKIHHADLYRITRAIEVYLATGKPLSQFKTPDKARDNLNPLILGLHAPKEILEKRIRERVRQMFNDGLIEEVQKIKAIGADGSWPALQGIGYQEFFVEGLNNSEIEQLIVKNSLRYAKRQMTFFRSIANVNWVLTDQKKEIKELLDNYLSQF